MKITEARSSDKAAKKNDPRPSDKGAHTAKNNDARSSDKPAAHGEKGFWFFFFFFFCYHVLLFLIPARHVYSRRSKAACWIS